MAPIRGAGAGPSRQPIDGIACRAIMAVTRKGRCFKTPLDKRCSLPVSEVLSRLNTWAAALAAPAERPARVVLGVGRDGLSGNTWRTAYPVF